MDKDKLAIQQYIHALTMVSSKQTDSQLLAGYSFEISNTSKSINLKVVSYNDFLVHNYLALVEKVTGKHLMDEKNQQAKP